MFLPRLILVLICSFVAFMTSHSAKCPHIWPPKRTPQYPFGKREANETVQQVDEATIEVHVPGTGFRFYESNFNSVFVHLDGIITFGTRQAPVRAMGFPHPDIPAITPLWVDVDTRRSGRLFVQSSVGPALLGRANKDIRRGFSKIASTFNSSWALVATWDKVGSFDKNGVKTNSFQCVLATNGSTSFALFIYYHKGSLQWSAGDADPERSYTIGVNAGDGVRYMSLHEESTSISSLASLSQQSNVDINGMWVLRVDSLYAKIPDWKEFDECATEPCKNNGLCKIDRRQGRVMFTCSCIQGFTGSCCERDENECSSNPCLNGGQCVDLRGSFKCNCSSGYSGVLCENMACGNGVVEQGEECDDGNKNVWDGCSDTCRVERLWSCSKEVGKLSSCHIKPIDLDKLNPDTMDRSIVYWNATQSVFIAGPDELDCGDIRSKDWELVDIILTNQMNQTEQIAFVPELARRSGQVNLSVEQVNKLRQNVVIKQSGTMAKERLQIEIVRKTGKSVDLSTVLLSICYKVIVNHTDNRTRTITVTVKLNSGDFSPTSRVSLQYVGQNKPRIILAETSIPFRERSSPVLIAQNLSLGNSDASYYTCRWATVSLTLKNEKHLREELALNSSSAKVNAMYNPDTLVLYLNGSAPRSVYENLLNSVTYVNRAPKLAGFLPRPVLFRISDGDHISKALLYVELQTINEPPVITVRGTPIMSFNEGEAPAELGGRVVITDPDGDAIHSASLQLQDAEYGDTISVDLNVFNVNVSRVSPIHMKLSGEADPDSYSEIISSVTFYNPTTNLTSKPRVLELVAGDLKLTSKAALVTITVEIVNSPPDITFGPEGHHVTIVAEMHGGPFHVFPKTTHFTDGDSRTAMSMRLLLSGAVDGLAEEIGINKNIASNFGLEWTSSWLNETTYHLEVTGLSYFEAYWELLQSVFYVHNGATPSPGQRIVVVVSVDDHGATSLPATVHIVIRTGNQPPQVNMGDGFGVDGSTVFFLGGETLANISSRPERIDIMDQDSGQIANMSVRLKCSNNQDLDLDEFVFLTDQIHIPDGLTVSLSPDGKSMNFTGPAYKAAFVEALQAIRYANAAEKPTLVAIDGSAKLERWLLISLCDTGTATGSDDTCSVAKVALQIKTIISNCLEQQGSNIYHEGASGPDQCSNSDRSPENVNLPRDQRLLQAPTVASVNISGVSDTFRAGALITIKFSHNVNKPPVLRRTDLQKILSLKPSEVAMSGHVGEWRDNRMLVIYFPRVAEQNESSVNINNVMFTFTEHEGACSTASSCKHAVCHADQTSCHVAGTYRRGIYEVVSQDVVDWVWVTLFITGVFGCLAIIAIYARVMLARLQFKNLAFIYFCTIVIAGCLCFTTILSMVVLTWLFNPETY